MTPNLLQFAGFTLDLNRLCLYGPTGRTDLRPKSFEVLRYLLEHPGKVVSKEEVMNAIWPNTTVSDESLTRCVSDVRRALGDSQQQIIKTVPRRGYLVDVPISPGASSLGLTRETPDSSATDQLTARPDLISDKTLKPIDKAAATGERKQVIYLASGADCCIGAAWM